MTKEEKRKLNNIKVARLERNTKRMNARVFVDATFQITSTSREAVYCWAVIAQNFKCQTTVVASTGRPAHSREISAAVLNAKASNGKKFMTIVKYRKCIIWKSWKIWMKMNLISVRCSTVSSYVGCWMARIKKRHDTCQLKNKKCIDGRQVKWSSQKWNYNKEYRRLNQISTYFRGIKIWKT